jgi:hypothetical protein
MNFVSPRLTLALAATAALLAACGGGDTESTPAGSKKHTLSHSVPTLTDAPAGLSGSVFCTNWRIGAVTVDNVEVPAGMTCQLDGTTVTGSVKALGGAILLAGNGVQVAGSIVGDDAHYVELTGATSRVAGNLEVKKGGGGVLASAEVGGTVVFEEASGPVSIGGARAGGGMKVVKNLGGATVANNTVLGALQCFDNAPAPAVGGNSADSLEGQCFQEASPPPPTPPSGNVTCVGLTIVGLNLDSVIVPDNANCTLIGARMNGNVQLGANARLNAQDLFVTGNLISDGAAELNLSGTSTIGGSVQVTGGAGASIAGAVIGGSLQLDAVPGAVSVSGNRIGGNIQAIANSGGVALNNNTMAGVMQCLGNQPAPTGTGNVAAQKEGQCAGL